MKMTGRRRGRLGNLGEVGKARQAIGIVPLDTCHAAMGIGMHVWHFACMTWGNTCLPSFFSLILMPCGIWEQNP